MQSSLIGSRWFQLGALLAAVTLLAPHARTQESPAAAPPLRVGVSPVFPPMVFKQQGQLVGIEVDLARAVGEQLGRAVTFVELPWEDQIEAVQDGTLAKVLRRWTGMAPR